MRLDWGHWVPVSRVVAIPIGTVQLLYEIGGVDIERELPHRRTRRRFVAWTTRVFDEVPAEAIVVDATLLAKLLCARCEFGSEPTNAPDKQELWQFSSRKNDADVPRVVAGRRQAVPGWIETVPAFDDSATVVAAVPQGWLFAAPAPAGGVAINLIIPHLHSAPDELLRSAVQFVWPKACEPVLAGSPMPCAPQLALEIDLRQPIPLGERAIFLDPLRGDGVGHAIRGAWLAHALIDSTQDCGISARQCVAHYINRLTAVFMQHLSSSAEYYRSCWNANLWVDEIRLMHKFAQRLEIRTARHFRLHGSKLERA